MPSSALFYPVLQDKWEMMVPEIPPPVTELCSLHTGPHLRMIIVLRCFTVIRTKRWNGPGERVNHQTRKRDFFECTSLVLALIDFSRSKKMHYSRIRTVLRVRRSEPIWDSRTDSRHVA
jgi:hypothetical protein